MTLQRRNRKEGPERQKASQNTVGLQKPMGAIVPMGKWSIR